MLQGKKFSENGLLAEDSGRFLIIERESTFGRGEYRDLFMMALTRADFKK